MHSVLAGSGPGPGRDLLPALPGRLRRVPGHVTCAGRYRRAGSRAVVTGGVSGAAGAVRLSRRAAAICCPARTQDDGCPPGLPHHDRRARGPPFPARFREEKELMGRGISTAMTGVVAESALPSGGTAMGGEPGQRGCKHPGCGNPVPVSGRDRTRVFCSDACSRRFHNAARSAGGDGETVSPRCRFRAGSRFHVRLFRAGNQGGAIWRSAAGCPIIPDRSRSSSPTWAVSAPTCSRSGTSGCTWTTLRWSCRSRPADPSTAQM